DAGLRIPDDIAVVGFDNVEETAYSQPSLTSVAPDKKLIAELAVAHLMKLIDGADLEEADTLTGFSLEVRESTTLSSR
ncbi:MAG: substrate-binding domain-containing protein, partial [Protaetiibacter sp.]